MTTNKATISTAWDYYDAKVRLEQGKVARRSAGDNMGT